MDLRPPILVVADSVTVDPATGRAALTGVRHVLDAPSYPSALSLGIYFFAGSLPPRGSVEIRLGPAMTEESALLWEGRLEPGEVALTVSLPAVRIPRAGFYDFHARMDGRRVAWTRVEARLLL
jgi:hypothetical protein